ncbi:MAG: hypothetical protein EA392_03795 [Cryomorphaceae bacterium]|nr:MAG: hypothetical protein EA392_03795 [Cryomorphaceae bacterium]
MNGIYLPCTGGDFIPSPGGMLSMITLEGPQFTKPVFNPNNACEFVYQRFDNSKYQLRRHNFETGEDVLLLDDVSIISKPSWGTNDWIAFDSFPHYRIRAVHARDQTVVQISDEIYRLYPMWMPDGDEILYQYSPVLGIPYYLLRVAFNPEETPSDQADTLFVGPHRAMSVAANSSIIAGKFETMDNYFFGFAEIQDIDFNLHVLPPDDFHLVANIFHSCVSPDGTTAYFTTYLNNSDDGLYRVNLDSKTHEKVLEHCRFSQIKDIDHAPDSESLLIVRQHERFGYHDDGRPDGKIYQQSRIYLLDLHTLAERAVLYE